MFNRANLGLPQRDMTSATAGVVSDLAGDPRLMQLSLRLGFQRVFHSGVVQAFRPAR
jgi:hypothetical protein